MLQRKPTYISSMRARLRLLTPFLCFCLIFSLTWYESSLCRSINITFKAAAVAGRPDVYSKFTPSRVRPSHRLPSLLATAPQLPSVTRMRPENRATGLLPVHFWWAVASGTSCPSFLRIDPVAWRSRTPSFLLPSSYGLVPFAIPPPPRLV